MPSLVIFRGGPRDGEIISVVKSGEEPPEGGVPDDSYTLTENFEVTPKGFARVAIFEPVERRPIQ